MASKYLPIVGDLIFPHSISTLGRLIQYFERHRGEPKTYANHVGGVCSDDGVRSVVVEALWSVVSNLFDEWAEPEYEIWRHKGLTPDDRRKINDRALSYIGRPYGWWKLGGHLIDGLFGKMVGRNVYLARRVMCLDNYVICSWVWAWAYDSIGYRFGISPRAASPDMMHDFVMSSPDWDLVLKVAPA